MQTVAASAGVGIVECDLKIIRSQKPIESSPRFFPPAGFSCRRVGLQRCRDDPAGFTGLLVEASLFRFLRVKTVRANRYEMAFYLTALILREPVQRVQSGGNHLFVRAAHSSTYQGLRYSRIGIRETIFKPIPIRRMNSAIRI